MPLQLFNSLAQLDLSVIDPAQVALLSDTAQEKLAKLIDAFKVREAATERWLAAQRAVISATQEQAEALAEHIAANPPMTQIEALRAAQDAYRATH